MSNSCKNRCAPSVNSSHTGEFIIRARRTEDDVNSEKYITAINLDREINIYISYIYNEYIFNILNNIFNVRRQRFLFFVV